MSNSRTKSVVKAKATVVMNEWLRSRGYEIAYYDEENANFTVLMLAEVITALNYTPKLRKKYAKKYAMAKRLYKQVHVALREWEMEHCREMLFEDFPSEILRREVQDEINAAFYNGFKDIEKYLENVDIMLVFSVGRNNKKKRKKRKKSRRIGG